MSRNMVDSGVEWIGKIPEGWNLRRLKFCCKVTTGNLDTQDADPNGEYPFYVRSPIVERSSNPSFEGEGILMAGDGAGAGRIFHHAYGIYAVHQRVYRMYDFCIDANFLYWYLQSIFPMVMDGGSAQSTVPSVRLPMLLNLPICCTSSEELCRITSCLSQKITAIDDVLVKTQESIEEYKKLKQAVITEAVTKGIRGKRPMKDSGIDWIGQIPADWSVHKVKRLLFERKDRSELGTEEPLSMSQVYGLIPTKDLESIPNMASSFIGAKLTYSGDLVFNKLKAHLGVFSVSKYDGLVSPDYAVYCATGLADLTYLEFLFRTPQCIHEFKKRITGVGAGLSRLYTGELFSISCAIPPKEEQIEISKYLYGKRAEIDTLISKKQQFIEELTAYKKSLIYEYVTGKKEVPA